MFRMILNYQQHSPASYGREVAKSDFSFDLSKCFFQLFLEIESPANPLWERFRGLVNKINACARNYFFHFFLGVLRVSRESLSRDQRQPLRTKNSNEKPIKWQSDQSETKSQVIASSSSTNAKECRLPSLRFAVTPASLVSKSNARNAAHSIQSANWTRADIVNHASMLKSYPLPIIFEPVPLRTKPK